jgi:hypothetical protein
MSRPKPWFDLRKIITSLDSELRLLFASCPGVSIEIRIDIPFKVKDLHIIGLDRVEDHLDKVSVLSSDTYVSDPARLYTAHVEIRRDVPFIMRIENYAGATLARPVGRLSQNLDRGSNPSG